MKYPFLFLLCSCLAFYILSALYPFGLGSVDYLIHSFISLSVLVLASRVGYLKTAVGVMIIQLMSMFLAVFAMFDGHIVWVGFWYENYLPLLALLNAAELMILICGVPWSDAYNRFSGKLYKLWLHGDYGYKYSLRIASPDQSNI